jgi:hypothetical protein
MRMGGEFDFRLGAPGLHTIAQKVQYVERNTILPPELVGRLADQCFWRDKGANSSRAVVLAPRKPRLGNPSDAESHDGRDYGPEATRTGD